MGRRGRGYAGGGRGAEAPDLDRGARSLAATGTSPPARLLPLARLHTDKPASNFGLLLLGLARKCVHLTRWTASDFISHYTVKKLNPHPHGESDGGHVRNRRRTVLDRLLRMQDNASTKHMLSTASASCILPRLADDGDCNYFIYCPQRRPKFCWS